MRHLTLSFDNGPDPAVTPPVLDVLARHHLAATFFVIGRKLADPAARACAERAAAEGHWIGNHTWTHEAPLGRLPAERAAVEIGRTQHELGALAHPCRWFRPMGAGGVIGPHLLSHAALALLERERMSCVLWNAIPRDWAEPEDWVETALAQIERQDWTLIVLHDLPTGAMDRLDEFLRRVADAGVTVRQDFPPACLPIRGGAATGSVGHLVS